MLLLAHTLCHPDSQLLVHSPQHLLHTKRPGSSATAAAADTAAAGSAPAALLPAAPGRAAAAAVAAASAVAAACCHEWVEVCVAAGPVLWQDPSRLLVGQIGGVCTRKKQQQQQSRTSDL